MRRHFVALVANAGVRRHCEGLSYSAWHPELRWSPPDSYSMGMQKFRLGLKRL